MCLNGLDDASPEVRAKYGLGPYPGAPLPMKQAPAPLPTDKKTDKED